MSTKNIERYFLIADQDTIDQGKAWYNDANLVATRLASKYHTSVEVAASVIAALSPRNKWHWNIVDADNLIAYYMGLINQRPKFTTFGHNVDKALKLCDVNLTHDDRLTILNGEKIKSFYLNILMHDSKVTVDTWIDLAYSGKYKSTKKRKILSLTRYKKIESVFLKLAKKYGIKPYELQAIVWLSFQKNIGVKQYKNKKEVSSHA